MAQQQVLTHWEWHQLSVSAISLLASSATCLLDFFGDDLLGD